jgi:cytoskeletal protein CcmA (bactofilin family)
MSILVGRSRAAFADLLQAVDQKTTFTLNSINTTPSINVQNNAQYAMYQANTFVFGALSNEFVCSNVTCNVTPLTIGDASLLATVPATFTKSLAVASNATFQSNVTVAKTVAAAAFTAANLALSSTNAAAATANSNIVKVDVSGVPLLELGANRVLSVLNGNVGVGTAAPAEALHVTENARVDGRINASNVQTYNLSDPLRCNVLDFEPTAIRVEGNMEVEGTFAINGNFSFRSNLTLQALTVVNDFAGTYLSLDNSNASNTTTLKMAHRVQSYVSSAPGAPGPAAYSYCNANPLLDATVILPESPTPFQALYVDAFGRMSLGNAAPTHLLNLDVQPYNSNATAEGLIYAKSLLANVSNVFVVDEQARVGVGTAAPDHALHVVIDDSYDTAAFAVDNQANYAVPFAQFRSNTTVLFDVDAQGRMSVGSNATDLASAALRIRGDVAATGTVKLAGLRAMGTAIDAGAVTMTGLSNVGASNVTTSVVTAGTVNATTVNATTVNMNGLSVDATAQRITASLNNFLFTGSNMSVAPAIADSTGAGYINVTAPAQQVNPKCLRVAGNGPLITLANVANGGIITKMGVEFVQSAGTTDTKGFITMNDETSQPLLAMGIGENNNILKFEKVSGTSKATFFNASLIVNDSDSRFGAAGVPKNVFVFGDLTTYQTATHNCNVSANARVTGLLAANDVNVAGTITAQHTILSSSDSNLKTDIAPIADALAKVGRLTGYTFRRTDQMDRVDTGLIAQEVAAVLPEAVGVDENSRLAVAYGNLAGLFVQAINQLAAKVDELEGKIKEAMS